MKDLCFKDTVMNRRSFLRLSGLLGLGVASGGIWPTTAEAVKFNRKAFKVSRTRLAMGTFVSMTLVHPSRDKAEEAMGSAFHEIDRLAGLMNRFDQATPVAQLNHEGYLDDIPVEIARVVAEALRYHRLSKGTFDICVKPVVDLYKKHLGGEDKTPLPEKALEQALELVDSGQIEFEQSSIHFRKPGMGITLDGIAKGYIVDRASETLSAHGVENFLINAGGDIRTMGAKGVKRPWTVAIQDPLKKRDYPDIVHMNDGAIATSGNYEIYYDRERMFHHIVDPRTGLSPALSASVSVMATSCVEADALSTSVFVMNPDRGRRFIDSLPRCECLIVNRPGSQLKSSGWKSAAI